MRVNQRTCLFLFLTLLPTLTCYCQTPTPTPTETLFPTPTPTLIVGDLDGDGFIGVEDQLLLTRNWHRYTQSATSEVLTITVTLTNLPSGARPLRLKYIPAGSFMMGSRKYPGNEDPRHQVFLGYGFYLGETEVTQAQWKSLMGSNPSTDLGMESHGVGDNFPVYYVSWDDCQAFCTALNALGHGTFRLPSEAEWEYACRGSAANLFRYDYFSFGDDPEVANLSDCDFGSWFDQNMWWCGNCSWEEGCQLVGTKMANDYGLYDMHGSVEEWCQDYWHNNYSGAPTDGSAWLEGTSTYRVFRGGAWDCYAYDCRSSLRWRWSATTQEYNTGLRIVREE